jgi:SAM-dependent methyltransferase
MEMPRIFQDLPYRLVRRAGAMAGLVVTRGHVPSESNSKWREIRAEDCKTYPANKAAVSLPSIELVRTTGPLTLEHFYRVGEVAAHGFLAAFEKYGDQPLQSDGTLRPLSLLDIGCGCGSLARHLVVLRTLRYVGFDLFRPSIDWCRAAFARCGERFRFEHFDGHSETYNPAGTLQPSDYAFPCEDSSIDFVYAGSLFTHLLEPDAAHYLREVHRVLKPNGLARLTIHNEPPAGKQYHGHEGRIDISTDYFVGMAGKAGLKALEFDQPQPADQMAILFKK